MSEGPEDVGGYLWRGGERMRIAKVPDRFTARLKRGTRPSHVEKLAGVEHQLALARENLDVFAVAADERDSAMARVRAADDVDFASHVYVLEGDPTSRLFLSDELTVQFKPDVSDAEIERIAAEFGLELVKAVEGVPRAFVFRLTPQATENPTKIANRIMATDRALLVEPNIVVPVQSFYAPTDALFADQWHLHEASGPFLSPRAHIDVERAWDITRGERSIVVAVADDSCDIHHADFGGADKIVAPRDFAGHDFLPLPETATENHGTACAGVAVAEENGSGVVGVAPGCALMPIRTSGMLDDNAVEELFGWAAERGASVISCSWGPAAIQFPLSLRQSAAMRRAAMNGRGGLGCVIVFAAGNANRPVSATVDEQGWPNNLFRGPTRWMNGFAAHADVMAVAACTSLARKSAYSNWGDQIAVCAPSNNAHPVFFSPSAGTSPTYPRITTPIVGRGIVTTDRTGASGYSSTDYTRTFGGTSSACPTVAGVAALVLSANPTLSSRAVREILQQTADKIVDDAADDQLGLSFGTYDAAGHSRWFGHGRVNAFKAVSEALRRRIGDGVTGSATRGESAPDLAIPDNDAVGVRNQITLSATSSVALVKVQVDIAHSYVGDLRVSLISPTGTTVALHDRTGARTRDLVRSFDLTTTPALRVLEGQPAAGAWTLLVQDLARTDIGRLRRWSLELGAAAQSTSTGVEDVAALAIPDNDPAGIERTLTLTGGGRIDELKVDLDITHTYIGDLAVTLVAPSGGAVVLHDRGGGSADSLITTYTVASLRGQPAGGAWRLRVADLEGRDVGKLNRWALRVVSSS